MTFFWMAPHPMGGARYRFLGGGVVLGHAGLRQETGGVLRVPGVKALPMHRERFEDARPTPDEVAIRPGFRKYAGIKLTSKIHAPSRMRDLEGAPVHPPSNVPHAPPGP